MLMWLQDDRDVRSYESFRYAPGYYIEDTSADWWNPAWGSQMQLQGAQQYGQPHDPQQDIQGEMPAPVRGEGLPMVGPAAQGLDNRIHPATGTAAPGHNALDLAAPGPGRRRAAPDPAAFGAADSDPIGPSADPHTAHRLRDHADSGLAGFEAPLGTARRHRGAAPGPAASDHADSGLANSETSSGTARGRRATHRPIAPRPAASDPAASAGSRPPAMPQLDPKVHNAELPPPQPPAGFNDQPPPRMYPEMYLLRHHERAPRNAQWPLNIEISLVEICTFCPSWFMIPEAVGRAIRNGWSREALTKAELLAENPVLDYGAFTTRHGRIQKQISQGAKMLNGVAESTRHHSNTFARHHGVQNDLTANSWRFRYSYEKHKHEWLGDVPLSMMYDKVVQWPTGNDRMIMTQCLEYARDNPERELDTSHWDWIIASQNLTAPLPLANGQHRDVEALERINQVPDPVQP